MYNNKRNKSKIRKIQVGEDSLIKDLDKDNNYKYLGIEENATNKREKIYQNNI